jgi:hypothetical protein
VEEWNPECPGGGLDACPPKWSGGGVGLLGYWNIGILEYTGILEYWDIGSLPAKVKRRRACPPKYSGGGPARQSETAAGMDGKKIFVVL